MKTLQLIILLYTIYGWIVRKMKANKGKYKLDPFDEAPTLSAVVLIICTIASIFIIIANIVIYLP